MDARLLINSNTIEPTDLPEPQGTVVQITGVDSVEKESTDGGTYWQHTLNLHGWRVGLRLNTTKINELISMLGQDTDSWVGKKIVLVAAPVTHFGQAKLAVVIIPMVPTQEVPISQVPAHMQPRRSVLPSGRIGQRSGFQLPAHLARSMQPQGAPTQGFQLPPSRDDTPIGVDTAIAICTDLVKRGKSWDSLKDYIRLNNPALAEAMSGKLPPLAPRAVLSHAGTFVASIPATREVPYQFDQMLRTKWSTATTPPAAQPQAPAAGPAASSPSPPPAYQSPGQPATVPAPATSTATLPEYNPTLQPGETFDPITGEVVAPKREPQGPPADPSFDVDSLPF